MKSSITLSYDVNGEYIVKKLQNRIAPQVGKRLKKAEVETLINEAKSGKLNIDIYEEKY